MLIVQIDAKNNFHSFESQSNRAECWMEGYIEVPKELEIKLITSKGYCDLIIEEGVLKNILPRPEYIPIDEEKGETTELDDINAILIDQEYKLTLLELGVTE